jgi:hypothetical protein
MLSLEGKPTEYSKADSLSVLKSSPLGMVRRRILPSRYSMKTSTLFRKRCFRPYRAFAERPTPRFCSLPASPICGSCQPGRVIPLRLQRERCGVSCRRLWRPVRESRTRNEVASNYYPKCHPTDLRTALPYFQISQAIPTGDWQYFLRPCWTHRGVMAAWHEPEPFRFCRFHRLVRSSDAEWRCLGELYQSNKGGWTLDLRCCFGGCVAATTAGSDDGVCCQLWLHSDGFFGLDRI